MDSLVRTFTQHQILAARRHPVSTPELTPRFNVRGPSCWARNWPCRLTRTSRSPNVVSHTGADGYSRLTRQARFEGDVVRRREYLLVDDFIGQGGTMAMRGWLETAVDRPSAWWVDRQALLGHFEPHQGATA